MSGMIDETFYCPHCHEKGEWRFKFGGYEHTKCGNRYRSDTLVQYRDAFEAGRKFERNLKQGSAQANISARDIEMIDGHSYVNMSNCCNALVRVEQNTVGSHNLGTYYVCQACDKACERITMWISNVPP